MREIIRVRYYECDMQRVVHNSVYLAWCDEVADRYFRLAGMGAGDWDVMVKTATVTWTTSATVGDEVTIEPSVSRWGNTSFDVTFDGSRDGEPVFSATITYVAVTTGTTQTVRVPDEFRSAVEGV
ncbi:acyl-CoA thioesterase [Actinospongicola halichondriae]|uniref:acyl-CoA thioesterase n=1 Tax=Actinospongicola halichondriae TaxID=3236844 RepID=UPI003D4C90C6